MTTYAQEMSARIMCASPEELRGIEEDLEFEVYMALTLEAQARIDRLQEEAGRAVVSEEDTA